MQKCWRVPIILSISKVKNNPIIILFTALPLKTYSLHLIPDIKGQLPPLECFILALKTLHYEITDFINLLSNPFDQSTKPQKYLGFTVSRNKFMGMWIDATAEIISVLLSVKQRGLIQGISY